MLPCAIIYINRFWIFWNSWHIFLFRQWLPEEYLSESKCCKNKNWPTIQWKSPWAHMMSSELTWSHLSSRHMSSCDVTWSYMMSPELTWCYMSSHDVTWSCMMSPELTWCHLSSHDVTWAHMMSHELTWCHMILHELTSLYRGELGLSASL